MKKVLFFVLFPFIVYCQQQYSCGELGIQLMNYPANYEITFKLTAIGAKWDENFQLTDSYEIITQTLQWPNVFVRFDHIRDIQGCPVYAMGLYKISAIVNGEEDAYFYIDWRTSEWSASLDVAFNYHMGDKIFTFSGSNQSINYTYQTVWDLTDISLQTSGFEDYWTNCLVAIDDGNGHPKLVWGPYPNIAVESYKLYRDIGSGFSVLQTLSSNTYIYTDNSVELSDPGMTIYYKVKPVAASQMLLPFSNTVDVTVTPFKVNFEHNQLNSFQYKLEQNYPNPFNPSTIISYSIEKDEFVTLKIFDILGREVGTLVNEFKKAGNHSVEFNAQNLQSGIYLYTLTAGKFKASRKLILIK